MLVLTRKERQGFSVGPEIVVRILRVKGRTVKVGIEAPDGMKILRLELPEEPGTEGEDGR